MMCLKAAKKKNHFLYSLYNLKSYTTITNIVVYQSVLVNG